MAFLQNQKALPPFLVSPVSCTPHPRALPTLDLLQCGACLMTPIEPQGVEAGVDAEPLPYPPQHSEGPALCTVYLSDARRAHEKKIHSTQNKKSKTLFHLIKLFYNFFIINYWFDFYQRTKVIFINRVRTCLKTWICCQC